MSCPFLRETVVWGCRSAHVRKLIPGARGIQPGNVCVSAEHRRCPGFVDAVAETGEGACPYLEQSLAQYCLAAPVTKFVPYSEPLLVRCGNSAFRYCDLYLEQAGPGRAESARSGDLQVPEDLLYSENHWWFDVPADGPWHAGLDAFASRLAGPAEQIAFLGGAGTSAAIVLGTASRDFTFAFPGPLPATAANPHLRLHPERVFEAPYTRGWIYEGNATQAERDALRSRFSGAADARRRLDEDVRRVNERIHEISVDGGAFSADGGLFEAGLLARLSRGEAVALLHAFCSPAQGRARE